MTMWDQLGGPTPPYASVGRRIGGWFLDGVVAGLVFVLFGTAPYLLTQNVGLLGLGYAAAVVLGVVQWWLLGTRGYTIGKRLVGTRVVDADTGAPIGMLRALLRYLVLSLLSSCFILLIVVAVLIGKDPRRQGWHDKAARSVEVEAGVGEEGPGRGVAGAPEIRTPLPPPPFPSLATGAPPAPVPAPVPAPGAMDAHSAAAASQPPLAPTAPPPPAPLPGGGLVGPPPGLVTGAPSAPMPTADTPTPAARPAPPAPPISPPAARGSWVLRPLLSEERVVAGSTLIGRDPDAALHPGAAAWRVDDPAFTVSKTHALVTVEGAGLVVEDLDSTHGVVIRRNGDEARIDTRRPTKLLSGDVIVLGAFEIAVGVVE